MKVNLTPKEVSDILRALTIAMQIADETKNSQDIILSDRLEKIHEKLSPYSE